VREVLRDTAMLVGPLLDHAEDVNSLVTGLSSSLWNYTTDAGFIPDVMVDTGTFQPTMPNCLT
jgi:hypothetical protein